MKILQLIDTLNPGGAERMALNYFLSLKNYKITSFLVVTRKKGILSEQLEDDSDFHFLNKRSRFDFKALNSLRNIIKKERVDVVHAHGSSWFFAVLCKLSGCKFKLIWHDHYGNSEFVNKRNKQPLKFFSRHFDGIITVNRNLEKWSVQKLEFNKRIIFLPNFIITGSGPIEKLKGDFEFNLVCTSNFRPQKNHLLLLKAFSMLNSKFSVALHLFGVNFQDDYSNAIIKEIEAMEGVYYYGQVNNISRFLRSADIGILFSNSEGLPLALLEYASEKLAVVCTDVGHCKEIVGDYAKLVSPNQPSLLADSIEEYLNDDGLRKTEAKKLHLRIKELYSEKTIVDEYLSFLKKV
ncbi:glycosyltransferase involved in cell wall biosynthesis [Christiangramia gaetbulicola]|uniref:Glycosyltransferase involved in cell wall biosynthesis n=1 Tax=Christiangramia gaetbulicola TaxID=703340 RepID=A0A2T6AJV5_9FLAO|nr:glycosyltransferase [Christiangramia gaetbulicola]PTX44056.1 glycosyltransferase involved in cell wall biosynthesis [Christiangramia gaetbulicola]